MLRICLGRCFRAMFVEMALTAHLCPVLDTQHVVRLVSCVCVRPVVIWKVEGNYTCRPLMPGLPVEVVEVN